jgi:circadian clock protein KaiC
MTDTVAIARLGTGVPGLDDVLGGGLPELSFNLIAGAPGCGKTTLAHQMMFAMASPERPALYFTILGETPLKMLRYQQQFEFFDADVVNQHVRFVNLADDMLNGDMDAVLARIVHEVRAHGPAFVFVDSFRSLAPVPRVDKDPFRTLQRFVQELGVLMASWEATTFLIGEFVEEAEASAVLTFADGLIWLRQHSQRNSIVRKLEVTKMRGQASMPGLHSYRISAAGLQIFTTDSAAGQTPELAAIVAGSPRVEMGTAGLDEMLGGGLPRGYSLLVAGPSGSGKSILAAAFLTHGAALGQTGVLVAFEQHPKRSRNPAIAKLIETDRIALVMSHALDLSVDEVLLLILTQIRRLKATRVVIDSLSGFELALAPTFRADFRESLSRLVTALSIAGVTVVLTSELEDRYADLRFSPHGTAFMTDAIVVQRYIEIASRLRRALAVIKVRASAHSDELREYHIDNRGIHVGATLSEYDGLLGGRPTQRIPALELPA